MVDVSIVVSIGNNTLKTPLLVLLQDQWCRLALLLTLLKTL